MADDWGWDFGAFLRLKLHGKSPVLNIVSLKWADGNRDHSLVGIRV